MSDARVELPDVKRPRLNTAAFFASAEGNAAAAAYFMVRSILKLLYLQPIVASSGRCWPR